MELTTIWNPSGTFYYEHLPSLGLYTRTRSGNCESYCWASSQEDVAEARHACVCGRPRR